MAKGLFLMMPAHGHVTPTIGLVSELLKKGDKITYICGEEFRKKFKDLDIKFIGFNEGNKGEVSIKERMMNVWERHLDTNRTLLELALKEEDEFDYVVVDPFIIPGEKLLNKLNIRKTISTTTTFGLGKEVVSDMEELLKQNTDGKL